MGAAETPKDGACCAGDEVDGTGVIAGYEVVAGRYCLEGVDMAGYGDQWWRMYYSPRHLTYR